MVVPGNWFADWFNSPYFYQLYFKRDEEEAAPFINKLITYLEVSAGSFLLDAACGKGRFSKILASYPYDVTGTDLSFYGINEARKSEKGNMHFFQHDMRLPFWINYFHYAFNLFTGFGFYKSEREHYNAVRTMANAVKPAGYLVLDYLNVHYAEDHQVHKTEKEIDGVNFYITKWYDETHFYKKIIVEDDQLEEPVVFYEKIFKFSLGDFNDMFAFHHLQIQEVFGDYQLNNYDVKKSPRLIMIAKKQLK